MADITSLAPLALSDKSKQYLQSFQLYYESLTSNTMLILRNMWNLDYTDSDTVFYDNFTYNPFNLPNITPYPLLGYSIIPFSPSYSVNQRRFKVEYQNVIDRISDLFNIGLGDLSFFDIETQNEITFNRVRNIVQFYKNKMNKQVYEFIFYLYNLDAKVYSLGSFDYLEFYRYDDATDLISNEYNSTGDGVNTSFTFTVFKSPIHGKTYHVFLNGIEMGRDDGLGNIIGAGVTYGIISYSTGNVQLTFVNTPTMNSVISSTYNFVYNTSSTYSDTNILLDTGYQLSNLYKTPFIEIELNMSKYYLLGSVAYLWYDILESYVRSQIEQVRYVLSKVYYTLRLDVVAECETANGSIAITNPNNAVKSITYNDGTTWASKWPYIMSYTLIYSDSTTYTGLLFQKLHDNIERIIGTSDGIETVFLNKIIQNVPIEPATVTLVYTIGGVETTSNVDNGAGYITGTSIDIATINYSTGEVGVSFIVPTDEGTNIKIYFTSVSYYFYIKHTATSDNTIIGINIINQTNTVTYIGLTCPNMYLATGNEFLLTVTG